MAQVQATTNASSSKKLLVIDNDVYDVADFLEMHPGGSGLLEGYVGTDATEDFFDMHRTEVLYRYQKLKVGRLDSNQGAARAVDQCIPGTLSKVPYSEPVNISLGWRSPLQNESHVRFRAAIRQFYDEQLRPHASKHEEANKTPTLKHFQAMGKAGILATHLGPSKVVGDICASAGIPLPGGLPYSEYTSVHEQICHEEHARLGFPGFQDGLCAGFSIATPCLVSYGSPAVQQKFLPDVLLGNKRICLAITEPFAGSDVAGLKCTARKTADGRHYIVNGAKKWITGGADADLFVCAVRTGGPGHGGISMLLVERSEGVETKVISTAYSHAAGTSYVTFENVKVPVENLLSQEGKGFKCIVSNFNHERWMIIVLVVASMRLVTSDCILWANQRKVFGKSLISQPVIRYKIGVMVSQLESCQAWLDSLTYQMCTMSHKEQATKLSGAIALLKFQSTQASAIVSQNAVQVFGGRGVSKKGMGQNIMRIRSAERVQAVYGGSEELMVDLGIRQIVGKGLPMNARL